ncbi:MULTISPECIES: 30S ribosomal protein S12 methylthiotransferase RimO [Agathobacter]|uniref:Ribosomal protein uS12 methylthiotransferase RimO n=1 Tax=Agathobacter ruminis TaxID=1712665 RepID=A0A2G3E4A0_9FIRM|nr:MULTISPECIES: 30S ribosomal protein S12 methylthiotransferase RimO [Agathobacter]MBQ1680756.1 30S ribosomal protein S12 methylthiotransferase RimO [Agathobacter sp.]MDC7302456.1 30S ribosomal protein S12 methylthiotransferase RimO [Agathobacter ruminis]PHU38089.1 30S ribosomal protein S12 methylthiotransferase RimO [Agathobacter ruminis]
MKILFISLGCDKNLVDSENMLGLLSAEGYEITDDETVADIIVVNSCCFIGDAKEESINTILEMAQYKQTGSLKSLIVTGCLAQRYAEEIKTEIPEVDAILGTNSYDEIANAIRETLQAHHFCSLKPLEGLPNDPTKRLLTTGGHFAYLKIAEGCNKNCAYCVIPSVRGRYRSKKMEDIIAEAKQLADNGVKELILVAQETTLYGIDLYQKKSLPDLLDALNEIPGLLWIRILYCYPEEITQELIDAMKRNSKVCHYLDMPIQHCNDTILRAMNRKTNKAQLVEQINHLREEIPDICLRTTLITGFPGETDEMHEEMMQFVNDMEFDRLGAFPYSPEENTAAYSMPNQVEEETKLTWRDEIMELEQEVIFDKNESFVNRELLCFIEGKVADENVYIGRTYRDAPNVDGYIFIHTPEVLMTGDVVRAKVTGAYEYDLIGELL